MWFETGFGPRTGGGVGTIDQNVTGIRALAHGSEVQSGRQIGWQILQAMNSQIRFVVQQGDLEFFSKQSLGQVRVGQRSRLKFVPRCLDNFDLKFGLRKGGLALRQNYVGLREGEGAAAGREDKGWMRHQVSKATRDSPMGPFPLPSINARAFSKMIVSQRAISSLRCCK